MCAHLLAGQLAALGVTLHVTVQPDRVAYAHMVRKKEIGDLAVREFGVS